MVILISWFVLFFFWCVSLSLLLFLLMRLMLCWGNDIMVSMKLVVWLRLSKWFLLLFDIVLFLILFRFMMLWDGFILFNVVGVFVCIVVFGVINRINVIDEVIFRRMFKKFFVFFLGIE